MKKIRFILLILIFTGRIFAQIPEWYFYHLDNNIFKTNENKILNTIKTEDFLLVKEKRIIQNDLSYAEILYGVFENFKANLTIARESENKGYIISYLREKMNSYNINSKKVYNSAFGIDSLETGINYSPQQEILLNLNFMYKYFTKGMLLNPIYDAQNKWQISILPEFKYFFSENSIFSANIDYNKLNLEFESSASSYNVNINSIKSIITYEKVWSEINALSFNFIILQYTLKYSGSHILNNIGIFNIEDKFALSKKTVINIGAGFNINKRYSPIFSPLLQLYFILKPINIILEAKKGYNVEYCKNLLLENYFVKINKHFPPEIETAYSVGINFKIVKNLSLNIKAGYHTIENMPALYEDIDNLFYVDNINLNEVKISTDIDFTPINFLSLKLFYENIPYIKSQYKKIPYLSRNNTKASVGVNLSDFRFLTQVQYSDIRDYINAQGISKPLKSFIFVNFEVLYLFTQNFGIKVEGDNIVDTGYIKIANYPEAEKIYRFGLYTKF